MRKTFKYRLYPNKAAEKKLYFVLNHCRELYNAALSERKDAYKLHEHTTIIAGETQTVAATVVAPCKIKSITYFDQQNDLPEMKADLRPECQDIASHVLQDVLRRLDRAFQNFFRRVKNGEEPGYPRFQGRNRYCSFTYPDGAGWKLDGDRLNLTKIGSMVDAVIYMIDYTA